MSDCSGSIDEGIIIQQENIEFEQFQVYYQPKYDLHTEVLVGAEALVRWMHPEKGLISPGLFIPMFEKNGCITQLDHFVWEKVCRDIRNWMDKGYPVTSVSVNVSKLDISALDLKERLIGLTRKYDIPVEYLHIEISESSYGEKPEQIVEAMTELHNAGFVIEMDGFGNGPSSLNALAQMPIDVLKLNMKFIQTETAKKSENGKGILEFVIHLAQWMNMTVIAEGVETAEQISSLLSMDCNYVQGYYYAKPMPDSDFENILRTAAVASIRQVKKMAEAGKNLLEDEGILMPDQIRYRYILDNLDVAYFELSENDEFYASDKYSLYALSDEDIHDVFENGGSYQGIHQDDLPKIFEFYKQKKKNLPKVTVTLRLKMKNGTYRWTEMMNFFEYDKKGNRIKSIGVLKDVDKDWVLQNKRLQEALDAAEQANQAKTDFLARVSHDMRTPLNGILGLTKLMEDKVKDPELSEDLEQLGQSGKYLLNLIDDTLDVSKIESGKLELHPSVCDGRKIFDNVLAMVRPAMEAKKILFNLKVEQLPFTKLYIDEARVEQVVMNALSNAVKFTPEGGTVEFSMENLSNEQGVITDRIQIRDTGIGMSKKFQEHLFEPFSQERNNSKSIYQGTGLGLTISKRCLELMGGSIHLESEEGEGTEVTIILPMKVATEEQIKKIKVIQEIDENEEILNGKRILLCEDHPLNATIAMKLLAKKGLHVEHAENGEIGVQMFQTSSPGYYDAILMDIRMPMKDGLEATREIRALQRDDAARIPIIAMTANALSEDVRNSIDAGMSEHLGKPIEPEKLYRTLYKFLKTTEVENGRKVLIVDDIEMNRGFMKAAIKSSYEVFEAGNGKEALDILRKQKDIDVVITDLQMPLMDGKELIKQIRADSTLAHVAILANTIYGDHRQEDELLALGADDFVYKPSSTRVILMRLEHIIRNMD